MAATHRTILTDTAVKNLKPGTVVKEVADHSSPGLRLRVSPLGRKVWFYRYRDRTIGKQVKVTLGTYPGTMLADARREWAALRASVNPKAALAARKALDAAQAAEVLAEGVDSSFTVKELVRRYVDHASRTKRSWKKDSQILDRTIVDRYGSRPARSITKGDVRDILDTLRSAGKTTTSNRVLATIRRMYNWALENDLPREHPLLLNPCTGLKAFKEVARQRALSDAELRTLCANLTQTDLTKVERRMILFILATGVRGSEAAGLRWSEVHGSNEWRIPDSRTKNGKPHTVYLSAFAQQQMGKKPKKGGWVFPNKLTDAGHIRLDTAGHHLGDAMDTLALERFTLHDLRRTMASWLGNQQVDDRIIDRMLNHQPATLARVYNVSRYDKPAAEAWARWSEHLQSLTAKNVVKLEVAS